jgi:hypothetical protein
MRAMDEPVVLRHLKSNPVVRKVPLNTKVCKGSPLCIPGCIRIIETEYKRRIT